MEPETTLVREKVTDLFAEHEMYCLPQQLYDFSLYGSFLTGNDF